jgi:hypothetical protein
VLVGPVSLQGLEPITGRDSRVVEATGDLQLSQLAPRDRDEKAWMMNLCFNMLRQWEAVHFQYVNGTMDSQLFDAHTLHLAQFIHSPLVADYWAARRKLFTPRFRDYIDGVVSGMEQDPMRYGELGKIVGSEGSSGTI